MCFEFGIELDKDTENDPARPKDQPPELAIEIPANRYDMLCFEGRIPAPLPLPPPAQSVSATVC